jgi:bifunctional non-homologous end joining protein LigD
MPPLKLMMATLVPEAFDDPAWVFEPKWDGVRAAAICDKDTRLISRNERDITVAYPELHTIHERVDGLPAILDGEIVAFEDGAPSFEKLQSRMHVRGERDIARLMKTIPVVYVVFDVLYVEGRDVTRLPYVERRQLLESKVKATSWLQLSPAIPATGVTLFEAAREQGLEGIVAKRADSTYELGRRSKSWLKIKTTYEADVIVAGWSEGGGGHNGKLGSIITATYDGDALRYNGSVGTGFNAKSYALVQSKVEKLATTKCPFPPETLKGKPELRRAHWVRPKLVAMVEFRQLTSAGKLRAPSFKGLRTDKEPKDCTFDELRKAAGL